MYSKSLLKPLLVLVGIHSFIVGILLLFLPATIMEIFGYNSITEPFFVRQGGVFHLVMSIVYFMAAYYYLSQHSLIILTVIAKMFATVFLFTYYILISQIWVVLVSAFGDVFMAVVILILYNIEQQKNIIIHA